MATTSIEPRPQLAPTVHGLLTALRGRIRRYIWLEGVASGVAWLGVAFWVSLAVDWFFEPPWQVRAVMLAAAMSVLVGVLVKLIGRRAFVPLPNSSMATVLERRFADLDDSLLTAVVLTGPGHKPQECSPQMLAHTCREAEERIGGVRLRDVFNPAPLRKSLAAALLLAVSVSLFAYKLPAALGVWVDRNLLFSNELWPRKTHLEIEGFEDGVVKVARGSDLEVIVLADTKKLVPETAYVRYRIEGGRRDRQPMNRLGEADPALEPFQEYSYTFQGVLAPIDFEVIGGDYRIRDLRIEVVDNPTIDEMVVDCRFPAYMDRTRRTLPMTPVMQIPLGSRLDLICTANKDLECVQIDSHSGDSKSAGQPASQKVLSERDLSGDRRRFRHEIASLDEDTTLLFTLSDTDGITGHEPIRLALVAVPDELPNLTDVRLTGIGSAITAVARLPAAGRITDDYGVDKDKLVFDYTIDEQDPAEYPIAALASHATEHQLDAAMEVGDLGLTPGQELLVCVKASDRFEHRGAGPNVGTSERWLKDVVTRDQLRAMLESRELVLRQRFERIIDEVTESRDLLLRIEFDAPGTDEKTEPPEAEAGAEPGDEPEDEPEEVLSPERRLARRIMAVQRAMENSRKNANGTLGVAEAFDDVRLQFINNQIDTKELNIRLKQRIADPLRHIAETMFPELLLRLQRLEAKAADPLAGPRRRDAARQQADAIRFEMQKVLDQMLELETFNEAVELLREIIEIQEELGDRTKQRHGEGIRDLMED